MAFLKFFQEDCEHILCLFRIKDTTYVSIKVKYNYNTYKEKKMSHTLILQANFVNCTFLMFHLSATFERKYQYSVEIIKF